jgi:uncharacterized membrane protein
MALISVFTNFGGIIGPVVICWRKTTTNSFSGGLYYVAACALVRKRCRKRGKSVGSAGAASSERQ